MDTSKHIFQLHGVDAAEKVVLRRKLRRKEVLQFFGTLGPTMVGIEASGGAHHWARKLTELGHTVRLIAPQYVKPYVKRGKNDAADAEAICEAVTRPTMRFVAIKSREQQSAMILHRVRLVLCRQRTQLSNALRGHLAEFGVVGPVGRQGLERLLDVVADADDKRLPAEARLSLQVLADQLAAVKGQILENDRRIMADARRTELGRRLMDIPGVGPLLASALVATVSDPGLFRSGRDLAAWIGLVPRQNSSGGKERLGSISKAGHRYLRQMLVVGSMAVIRHAGRRAEQRPWLTQLLARRKVKVAAVALANKIARIVWAMMITGDRYREPVAV